MWVILFQKIKKPHPVKDSPSLHMCLHMHTHIFPLSIASCHSSQKAEVVNLDSTLLTRTLVGHVLCSLLLCWKQGHGFGVEMSLTVKICQTWTIFGGSRSDSISYLSRPSIFKPGDRSAKIQFPIPTLCLTGLREQRKINHQEGRSLCVDSSELSREQEFQSHRGQNATDLLAPILQFFRSWELC